MQFEAQDDSTILVSENGVIGYIIIEDVEDAENVPSHRNIFFEFKAGVNPSLTLDEMKEIVRYMEGLK
jgi:hypothetical protein